MKKIILSVAVLCTFPISAQCFQKTFTGKDTFFAISQDGSLWGWGANGSRQLGDGTTTNRLTPVEISNDTWRTVAAGPFSTVAIKADGTLWSWGTDTGGQLGNGAIGTSSFPAMISSDTNWKEVTVGYGGTLALKTDGTLWGWGANSYGYLGNGEENDFIVDHPIPIGTDSDWKTICGKGFHCLAIKTDGSLWSWGSNGFGQLGVNSTVNSYVPVQVGSDTNWKWIEDNVRLSFAGKTDGTLWGWGTASASGGALGLSYNLEPLKIGFAMDWQSLSLEVIDNNDYAILLKTNGTLWSWGRDSHEQLGNGAGALQYTAPTQIGTDADWVWASAGNSQGNAVKTVGTFWVWGDTALVGDGTNDIAVPTQYNCTLGVIQEQTVNIQIYPNPATSIIYITGMVAHDASVFDMAGRQYPCKNGDNSVNVSSLSSGIYFLKLTNGTEEQTIKFWKE